MERGYRQNLIDNTLSKEKFQERTQALLQRNKARKRILPFVTQYHPAVPNVKEILKRKWYLIQQQPLLSGQFRTGNSVNQDRFHAVNAMPTNWETNLNSYLIYRVEVTRACLFF